MQPLTHAEKVQTLQMVRRWMESELSEGGRPYLPEYFVNSSGNLNQAVSTLKPGDTLYLRAGTYPESLFGAIPGGTDWERPVTIAAYPGEQPTICPPVGSYRVLHFGDNGKLPAAMQKFIVIDGLMLDARNVQYDGIKIEGEAHHIRITNCEIMNHATQGILIPEGGGEGNEILNNKIHGGGWQKASYDGTTYNHGIYISTSRNLVEGNEIWNIQGHGVHVYAGYPNNNGNRIRNNTIYDVCLGGPRGAGIGLYSGKGHEAIGNVIRNANMGIRVEYYADETIVTDNKISGITGVGIFVGQGNEKGEGAAVNTIIARNTVIGSGGPGIYTEPLSVGADIRNNTLAGNGRNSPYSGDERNLKNDSPTSTAADNYLSDS